MRHDFSNILSEIYPVNDYIIHLLDSSDVAVIIKHTNTSFPCFPDIKGSKDSMFFRRFLTGDTDLVETVIHLDTKKQPKCFTPRLLANDIHFCSDIVSELA